MLLMTRWIRGCVCLLAAFVCVVGGVGAAEDAGGLLGGMANDPVSYQGGEVQYLPEKNAVALLGYATLTKGPVTVKSRNMVYFRDSHEVYAEGNVTLIEPGGSTFECESLYFNMDERRGEANAVRIMGSVPQMTAGPDVSGLDTRPLGPNDKPGGSVRGVNRLFVTANTIRSFNADHQELHRPSITNDNSPKPFIRVSSSSGVVERNEKVASLHNVLWIGKLPVFYFPYIIRDLRYDWPWMRFTAGRDSDWGTYALSTWGWDLSPDKNAYFRPEELFFDVDWRQDRGLALGVDLKYTMGHRESKGYIDTYWLRETAITDEEDLERAQDDTELGDLYQDEDRYKVEWRHFQQLTDDWDIRAEAHYYSDRDFREEYFNREYREAKEPETSIDIRRLRDTHVLEFVAQKRVNDWQTEEEYLPEARLNVPGLALGNSGFFLSSDTRIGVINKRHDKALDERGLLENAVYKIKSGDDYGAYVRAYTDTRLSYPIRIANAVTFTPYVGGRLTYYEEAYDDDELEDENHLSVAPLFGATLSTRVYNTFTLKGNDWRHVIEPTLSYNADEDPTIDRDALYSVDDIDQYQELHVVTARLHQKLQTRRAGVVIDVLDFDIAAKYLPEEAEQRDYNFGDSLMEVTADVVWRPTSNLVLYADTKYSPAGEYFSEANVGMDFRFRNIFRVFAENRYRRGDTLQDPGLAKSNLMTMGLRVKVPGEKYTIETALSYEGAHDDEADGIEHGLVKERVSIIRNIKVFDLAISYVHDERKDDHGVYFTLTPVGIDPHDRGVISDDALGRRFDGRYHPAMDNEINMQ